MQEFDGRRGLFCAQPFGIFEVVFDLADRCTAERLGGRDEKAAGPFGTRGFFSFPRRPQGHASRVACWLCH